MAVALSAEKQLEERIDRSGRTLARKRIPYAARRKNRHSRSRNQQKRQLPHFPPFLCNSPARIRLQHPHHTGTSRSQRYEHHHDLYHVLNRGAGGMVSPLDKWNQTYKENLSCLYINNIFWCLC